MTAIVDKRRSPRFQDSLPSLCARGTARHVPEVHCLHDYESKRGGCVVTLQARDWTSSRALRYLMHDVMPSEIV